MTLKVNGEARVVRDGMTVADLLTEMGVVQGRVAIELNETVVPRAEHERTHLSEGDRVEVVSFMGGGVQDHEAGRGKNGEGEKRNDAS